MKTLTLFLTITGLYFNATPTNNENRNPNSSSNKIEIVTPNNSILNTSNLTDFNYNYIVYLDNPDNTRQLKGFYNYELKKIQSKAQSDVRIKKELVLANGKTQSDVTMMTKKTLKPKYVLSKDGNSITLISYTNEGIEGTVMMNATSASFSYQTSAPVFDVQSTDLIIQSLPLENGYQATFWTYSSENESSVDYQNLKVVNEVKTKVGNDKLIDAFVVEVTNSTNKRTYTIAKSSKTILKVIQKLPNGKELVIERI